MAYKVLALKYRPQQFDEIVGQFHVTNTLKNAIKFNRIAHAYLFTGPKGVGKTTTARILAKALNCEKGLTPDPCNKCSICREIQLGISPDVIEIDGASNRKIEDVRNLQERLQYSPTHGRYRVYIIDEVHMLTNEAFNALLKTIEEPPQHVIFVFATTAPNRVPGTILSRCQRFDFRPVSINDIVSRLRYISERENIKIEENALRKIAQVVQGSLRDAISLLDQLWSYVDGEIKTTHIDELLGTLSPDVFKTILDYIMKSRTKELLKYIEELYDKGISPEEIISGFVNFLNEGLKERFKLSTSRESFNIPLDVQQIVRMLRFLFDTEKRMRDTLLPQVYLESALLELTTFTKLNIEELIRKLESKEKLTEEKPPKEALEESEEPVEEVPPEGQIEYDESMELFEKWKMVKTKIKKQFPTQPISLWIEKCIPLNKENGTLILSCDKFYMPELKKYLDKIQPVVKTIFAEDIRVEFVDGKGVQKPQVQEDKTLEEVMKEFDAELVKEK